jgi:hypothetical protein
MDGGRSDRDARIERHAQREVSDRVRKDGNEGGLPWPSVAIGATYKYLFEGVRILAQAYTTYDDRSPQ